MYVGALTGEHANAGDLVALFDVNPGRLALHADAVEKAGAPRPLLSGPDDLERVIREQNIDRVIVTSPDRTHAEMIVRAHAAGADVVVEKPLTIDVTGARSIVDSVQTTGRDVVVTFNYRYSPRNTALKEVVASGRIGEVTSVHFEWVLDTNHGADYFRRWHSDKANSGGLLIHKASHHFDLVNWWIDDVPTRVFASGGLRFYGAEQARRRGLGDRPERGTVDGSDRDPFLLDLRTDPDLEALYLDNEHFDGYRRDQDVFRDGITIEDNLSLVVDYEKGASMSYSLNAHSPWEGYVVSINGTKGRAELTVVERGSVLDADAIDPSARPEGDRAESVRPQRERLVVQNHWGVAEEIPIPNDGGAHGGGDALLLRDVFDGPEDDPLGRPAGWLDGLRSVAVGIAGNESLRTGQAVRVEDLGLGVDLTKSLAADRVAVTEKA
ncbi:dehydrogenase [Frondihabitans sucicola]|uniref:Dehydrogenase n=2 Tax=Frondihabitans sucicola TaxID=1268041 RepID=A0ABM8GHH6_9MICO|nr:dehydrogenase [Frondihabitans sucicola]BDZ52284.1 dehydrogenase [Frondihabitans sucicola]